MLAGHASPLAGRPSSAASILHGATQAKPTHRKLVPGSRIVTRAGIFDFIKAPGGGSKTVQKRGRAQEIVDQLLELSEGTDGGIKASGNLRDEIEELVDELEAYCPRNPLRSQLIFGEWEVTYASKPQTAGGPFRSPLGRAVFPGQRAIQVIEPPNVCVNEVSYKTLGLIPGAARQEGEIEPLDEKTFQLTFPAMDGKLKGAGGPPKRVIEVAYLDERVRVARALPQEEGKEGSFYIFKRIEEEEESEEEEEEEAVIETPRSRGRQAPVGKKVPEDIYANEAPPQPAARRSFSPFGTQIFGKKAGMATQAERSYNEKRGGGTRVISKRQPAPVPQKRPTGRAAATGTGTTVRKSPAEAAAERAAAKAALEAERRVARERAAAEKAAVEEERRKAREAAESERQRAKQAAEAQRAAIADRREAAKAQYNELTAAAAEANTAARDAATAAKAAERETAGLLRQAAQARGIIDRAVAAAQGAAGNLKAEMVEEVDAEKEVLSLQRAVNDLQKRLRQQAVALAPPAQKK